MHDLITAYLPEPKDYFQMFRLSSLNGIQRIEHEQKQPPFKRGVAFFVGVWYNEVDNKNEFVEENGI